MTTATATSQGHEPDEQRAVQAEGRQHGRHQRADRARSRDLPPTEKTLMSAVTRLPEAKSRPAGALGMVGRDAGAAHDGRDQCERVTLVQPTAAMPRRPGRGPPAAASAPRRGRRARRRAAAPRRSRRSRRARTRRPPGSCSGARRRGTAAARTGARAEVGGAVAEREGDQRGPRRRPLGGRWVHDAAPRARCSATRATSP